MSDPPVVVIDASVALAIVREEPEGRDAEAIISRFTTIGARFVVPAHFWLEVSNSLMARRQWSGASALEAVHDLDDMRLETIQLDRVIVVLAIDLIERHGLTAYDAAYLALADWMDASLMTLDVALRAAAGDRALAIGPTRLSETPAPYERAITWPDYKGASAFLATLRAEAARPG